MKLGIRAKLTGLFLSIILVLLVVVSLIVFFTYKSSLDESLLETAFFKNKLIQDEVELWFTPLATATKQAAGAAPFVTGKEREIIPLFEKLLKENEDFSTVFWASEKAYKDGGFFYDATGWVPDADYDQWTRAWFNQVKQKKTTIITDPYIDLITKKLVVSIAVSVEDIDGTPLGVMGSDVFITQVGEMVKSNKISENGQSFLINQDGLFIVHDDEKRILNDSLLDNEIFKKIKDDIFSNDISFGFFNNNQGYYASAKMVTADWIYVTFGPMSDIYAPLWSFGIRLALIAFVGIVIAIIATVYIAKSITIPLLVACAKAEEIASGELRKDVDLKLLDRTDEFGQLAQAFQDMTERLRSVLFGIRESSNQVDSGAQQMSITSQQISQGATEQAASVEEISASMEEMASNIRQNADNAMQTEKIALAAVHSVTAGGEAVDKTVEAMKEIASKITIIEEIARSTNMLSLNASIEAARAGEYGKGFAVVAAEVGKLAERSQKEAGEISNLSKESVLIAVEAGETISNVIPDIKRTAELVQEISAASNEQTIGTDQINSAILQLDQVVQQNASASEESASMSEELAGQSQQMLDHISYFKMAYENLSERKSGQTVGAKQIPDIKKLESTKIIKKSEKQEPENEKRRGIHIILDDDVPTQGRDSLDNEYQEF